MEGLVAGRCQLVETPKPTQQSITSNFGDADDLIELRSHERFSPQLPMERNREAMRFVSDSLQEMGGRG